MITKVYCTFYDSLSAQDKISTQVIPSPEMKHAISIFRMASTVSHTRANYFRIGTIIIIYLRKKIN